MVSYAAQLAVDFHGDLVTSAKNVREIEAHRWHCTDRDHDPP